MKYRLRTAFKYFLQQKWAEVIGEFRCWSVPDWDSFKDIGVGLCIMMAACFVFLGPAFLISHYYGLEAHKAICIWTVYLFLSIVISFAMISLKRWLCLNWVLAVEHASMDYHFDSP